MTQPQCEPITAGDHELDITSWLTIAYLALPTIIFAIGWLNIGLSSTVTIAVILVLYRLYMTITIKHIFPNARYVFFTYSAIVAMVWTGVSGIGHYTYANADWTVRDAVLRDLSEESWPVCYSSGSDHVAMLRCPLAYYLPAAVIHKMLPFIDADKALYAWTVLGVMLFLCQMPLSSKSQSRYWMGIIVIILFSGMDIIPTMIPNKPFPRWGTHIEWWTGIYQYPSNTTALFWAPNHALPAWLAMCLFAKHYRNPGLMRLWAFMMSIIMLWSPFAFIGMCPFIIIVLWKCWRHKYYNRVNVIDLAGSVVIVAPVVLYFSLDIGSIAENTVSEFTPRGDTLLVGKSVTAFLRYCAFVFFEYGVLAALLLIINRNALLWIATAVLACLPFASMGRANDIVMRASAPSLIVMQMCILIYISGDHKKNAYSYIMATLLLIGAVTPLNEIVRAFINPVWLYQSDRGMEQITKEGTHFWKIGEFNPGYVAKLTRKHACIVFR